MLFAEPSAVGFSERMLGMLPWHQTEGQGGSCEDVLQQSVSIQQIAIMQPAQKESEQPGVVFSVLDRYSTLGVWQWSSDGADAGPMSS